MPGRTAEIYKDTAGRWRWRGRAANNEIIGSSSQGYVNRQDAVANARANGWQAQ